MPAGGLVSFGSCVIWLPVSKLREKTEVACEVMPVDGEIVNGEMPQAAEPEEGEEAPPS